MFFYYYFVLFGVLKAEALGFTAIFYKVDISDEGAVGDAIAKNEVNAMR